MWHSSSDLQRSIRVTPKMSSRHQQRPATLALCPPLWYFRGAVQEL